MPHVAIGRAVALACAALAFTAGAQTMYKWVDEKGTTHFSEHPPPDGKKASKVEPKVTPPSSEPPSQKNDPSTWKKQEADFRKRHVERGQREQASERERAERGAECDRAKRRLVFLQNTHRIYRDNADGTRSYMTDPERDAEMARQRDAVKAQCD
ncbi:MAG TPA: DUF4124 domain-containing protein [Usitatibacter sp.]|nr:DUF4124 domain-containing protein [Usitatibacter sp.]